MNEEFLRDTVVGLPGNLFPATHLHSCGYPVGRRAKIMEVSE